jgi:imidazolonepropionase-like amidohydrolase
MSFSNVPPASPELQAAVVQASHKHGLLALAHATNLEETKASNPKPSVGLVGVYHLNGTREEDVLILTRIYPQLVLRAGVDALTHTFCDQPPTDELISLYKSSNAFLIPTLCVIASITGEEASTAQRFARDTRVTSRSILTEQETENLTSTLSLHVHGASVDHAYAFVEALKAAGIDIVAGTDAVPGLKGTALGVSLMMELWLYVERCGFTPLEALKSATGVAARRFGFADRGVIRRGGERIWSWWRGIPWMGISWI